MSRLVLYMITSLDGFIAGPNGEFTAYEPSAEEMAFANHLFGNADAIVFGRVIYDGFVEYWDSLDLNDSTIPAHDREFAGMFREKARVVFSRTLNTVPANTTLLKDHQVADLLKIKQQSHGYLLLLCGPDLLATLIEHRLVDECQLLVTPAAMGQGMALFGALRNKLDFRLFGTQVFESGSVLHHYGIHYS